jgi:hypothetical protein
MSVHVGSPNPRPAQLDSVLEIDQTEICRAIVAMAHFLKA